MKALRVFRGLMAFLTAIPVKMDESFLDISARYMFLFPVIGVVIGVLVGFYARFTSNVLFLFFGSINNLIFSGAYEVLFNFASMGLASAMTIAFLLVIIGLQHTDGLVDVGNKSRSPPCISRFFLYFLAYFFDKNGCCYSVYDSCRGFSKVGNGYNRVSGYISTSPLLRK